MKRLARAVIVLTLVVVGCSSEKVLSDADAATAKFHAEFNASQFDAIYSDTTPKFRSISPKDDYARFISAVRRKLGAVKSTERKSWNVFVGTGGATITVTYATKFELGSGDEQFVWLRTRNGLKLVGWHINSNDLITR